MRWLLVAAGAALAWLASRGQVDQVDNGPSADNWERMPLAEYIRHLGRVHEAQLQRYRRQVGPAQVRALVLQAADRYGIPPEVVYGVLYGESRHKPVGVAYGGSVDKAIAGRDSGFGMGQITRTRFLQERRTGSPGPWQGRHDAMIDPAVAIDAVAASYARGYAKHGGPLQVRRQGDRLVAADVPSWVGRWWAGGSEDGPRAKRKRRQVIERGAGVWGAVANV